MPDDDNDHAGLRVESGRPLAFGTAGKVDALDSPFADEVHRVVDALKAYRAAVKELVSGKYSELATQLPLYFRTQTNMYVLRCTDGILVRHDAAADERAWIRCSVCDKDLAEMAPALSDQVVHLPNDATNYDPGEGGVRMTLAKVDAVSGSTQELFTLRPMIFTKLPPVPVELSSPGSRPLPLVSITNEFEIRFGGRIEPITTTKREIAKAEEFVAIGKAEMPVGWQAIELYPHYTPERWDRAAAPLWAELDVLAMLAHINITSAQLASLDGRVEARRRYAALLREFEALLDGPEEPVHQFLKAHPELVCPTSDKRWSKVPFGDRVSDFVFRQAHEDYELVEIEAPYRELFRSDGQQRQELTHAINQILDWVGHIQRNHLEVEEVLGLTGISTNPRCLVVIGRSASLTEENRKKLATLVSMSNKLRVLTYDDLLASARATLTQILGPLDLESNLDFYFFTPPPEQA